jgi:tRNA nucleotidyltransferase (CCA-adding enzyme)
VPYEFFPHTGDVGMRVWGRSLEELMRSAVLAFTDTVADPASVRSSDEEVVTCRAAAPDLLLHDLLSELVYQLDARRRLVRDADVVIARDDDDWTLEATTWGEPIDAARHRLRVLVKGVTYHALSVSEAPEGWQGTVVLDI